MTGENLIEARCLRAIWGIKPSYVSRISNARVLEATGQHPLTTTLQKQQLLLYGTVARHRPGNLMRDATFARRSLRPAVDVFIRKVGRPRLAWASEVGKLALAAAGGLQKLDEAVVDEKLWRNVVETFLYK